MRRWLWLLLVMPALALSAGVYRWTDDEGKVHFSTTPPPQAAGREEKVAETLPEVAEDLRTLEVVLPSSNWKGERLGYRNTLSFHDNGYFVESIKSPSGRRLGSFVGKWAFGGRMIRFTDVQVYRPGVESVPELEEFTIEYYREGVMKLRLDDGTLVYYRKDGRGAGLALPAEMRSRK